MNSFNTKACWWHCSGYGTFSRWKLGRQFTAWREEVTLFSKGLVFPEACINLTINICHRRWVIEKIKRTWNRQLARQSVSIFHSIFFIHGINVDFEQTNIWILNSFRDDFRCSSISARISLLIVKLDSFKNKEVLKSVSLTVYNDGTSEIQQKKMLDIIYYKIVFRFKKKFCLRGKVIDVILIHKSRI